MYIICMYIRSIIRKAKNVDIYLSFYNCIIKERCERFIYIASAFLILSLIEFPSFENLKMWHIISLPCFM
jgi:hypothetical protein